MRFAEILGQREQKNHLSNAISKNKISHAYIISGEEYSGKKMLAEAFASTLLCEKHGADACGECISCKKAKSHNHPDILYVTHDKPRTISVDDVREQINDSIVIKPYESDHKVYIVDEAELMREPAQNALLKTLEEPPEYAVIMLLTTNKDSFLPTIRSRCVTLETKPVADMEIENVLKQKYRMVDYEARACAVFAQGNVGKAVQLAGSEAFTEKKELAVNMAIRLLHASGERMVEAQMTLLERKEDLSDLCDIFHLWFRDVLLYKSSGDEEKLIFNQNLYQIRQAASELSYEQINKIVDVIDETKVRIRQNVVPETLIPILLESMRIR